MFAQEQFRINHGPYLQALTDSTVTIVWTTNKNSIGWVELAPNDSTNFYAFERKKYFDSKNGLKTEDKIHKVRIENLPPGTKYRYRIYAQEIVDHENYMVKYGIVDATRAFMAKLPEFITSDRRKNAINFGVVNDIHQRTGVLDTLLSQLDWKNLDFMVFNGDMVNNLLNEGQIFSSFMDLSINKFAKEIPFYYARGNHETRGQFADQFYKYFPTMSGKLYYMVRQGPICFIILDTGEDKPDSDIEYSGITDFDFYRSEQAEWLKNIVNSEAFLSAPYKIVIGHIPPFEGWHGERDGLNKFVPLLNKAGIQLMIAAHYHRSLKRDAGTVGVNFPVLVNSNHSVLKVTADENSLRIVMNDLDGRQMDRLVIRPNGK